MTDHPSVLPRETRRTVVFRRIYSIYLHYLSFVSSTTRNTKPSTTLFDFHRAASMRTHSSYVLARKVVNRQRSLPYQLKAPISFCNYFQMFTFSLVLLCVLQAQRCADEPTFKLNRLSPLVLRQLSAYEDEQFSILYNVSSWFLSVCIQL